MILLYLWGEQWAVFNRLSKSSFRTLFFAVNGAFYAIVVPLLVCEVAFDPGVLSSFDVVEDGTNVFQLIISWITITMYVGISIGFLIWGYIQFRRAHKRSTKPLLPSAADSGLTSTSTTTPQKSLVGSMIWAPHSRLQRLGILASACMILFVVRTIVLVLDFKYDNYVPFSTNWFELMYFFVFEIAPLSAMCITFFWQSFSTSLSSPQPATTSHFTPSFQSPGVNH